MMDSRQVNEIFVVRFYVIKVQVFRTLFVT